MVIRMKINSIDDIQGRISSILSSLRVIAYSGSGIDYQNKLYDIRKNILSLIQLTAKYYVSANRFDLWEKNSLSHALGLLTNNLMRNDTTYLLRACLSDIQQSTTERDERSDEGIDTEINNLNETFFLEQINKISTYFGIEYRENG
jgi:hypothetical protein